jgi:Glycosyltransferase family 87
MPLKPYADQLHIFIGAIYRADYPPTFLLMFEPLSLFSPWTAFWIWSAISVVLLLISLWLLVPAQKAVSLPAALIIISLGILYRPIQTHFVYLQAQILVLVLLIMMRRALKRGDEIEAGAWLAAAGLLKVYPLFMMLYLLCMRRWRALTSTTIILVAGFALTAVVIGPRSFGFFDSVVTHVTPVEGIREAPIVGIGGTIVRWFLRFYGGNQSFATVVIRSTIELILESIVLLITAQAIVRSRTNPIKEEYAFGLCIAALVLCYPNSWTHYMVLLLYPLSQIAIAAEAGAAPAVAPVFAAISYVLAEISYDTAHRSYRNNYINLGLWLIEGMVVSTVLVYAAAYALTVYKEPPPAQT